MLMLSDKSLLIVVDLQERLLPAIHEADQVLASTRILMAAANQLGIPVLVSEQYPKGLGKTADGLIPEDMTVRIMEKVSFSCFSDPQIQSYVKDVGNSGRNQLIICGTETHVCVLQTALEAKALGYEVFVVSDACSSRTAENKKAALHRMAAAGITCVSTEMVVFEWLKKAGTELFRSVSKLIK